LFLTFQFVQCQEPQAAKVDQKQKEAVVNEVNGLLNQYYVYPETAAKMAELITTRLKKGEYDKIDEAARFAQVISQDLRSVSKDKHLDFAYDPEMASGIQSLQARDEKETSKAREK